MVTGRLKSRLYSIQSQVFEGTPEMHVSGVEVVSMCLDAVVNGCASAALAAVGPMRFSHVVVLSIGTMVL